jgi:hypothetical protein
MAFCGSMRHPFFARHRSGFFEKAQEFVFGELELLEIKAQGAFIQIVSGVRFLE